jgi:two-component system sensor histidine kinase QseC
MRFLRFPSNSSLSAKLLAGTLAVLLGYVTAIGLLAYLSARSSIADTYDQSLVVNANVLLHLMQKEVAEGELNTDSKLNISDENLTGEEKSLFDEMAEFRMFRVWHEGKLVLTSSPLLPASVQPFPPGFSDQTINDDAWRIYDLRSNGLVVELGEQEDARTYLVLNIAQDLVLPFLLSLPAVVFLFWRVIRTGTSSLRKLASQVDIRSPEQLTPLDKTDVPPDLLPLVQAINALLDRLHRSLSRERQITELAAHELRTPLTAIKLQAQLGLKAVNEASRIKALSGLLEGVERASHLVEQLLALTRVEQSAFELHATEAGEILKRTAAALKPLSDRRGQRIALDLEQPLIAQANEDLLELTLANLVSNAIKYSPQNSEISLRGRNGSGEIVLEITDQGPGIPEHVRERIFERFFRYHSGKALGSGLGLTIARQCAGHMHADLTLHTPDGGRGLCVRLALPATVNKKTQLVTN